jgi:hypothetical protein
MNLECRETVREELLRSVARAGLGLVGWPVLVSEISGLDATLLTVVVLPVLTRAVLTAASVGIRLLSGSEFRVRTPAGLSATLVFGIMLGGVGAVYLVAAGGYPDLWVTAGYVAVTVGSVAWHWYLGLPGTEPNAPA